MADLYVCPEHGESNPCGGCRAETAGEMLMGDDFQKEARAVIDRWRDEWHLEPEPEMDGSNSKVYESLVDQVATALRIPRSPASAAPVVDKARYEKAHDARYMMTHPVHPDILVLWFLALKSHWFDDPANMFFGQREQAKAYLYKWVETGELADDNTTLEITVAMKFREWLKESWTPAAATAAPQDDLCLLCGHKGVAPDGTCMVPVSICSDDYHGGSRCGCKCRFRDSAAAPVGRTALDEVEAALISIADGVSPQEAVGKAFNIINSERARMIGETALSSSTSARAAAEEIREWIGISGLVDGQGIDEVAAIVAKHGNYILD